MSCFVFLLGTASVIRFSADDAVKTSFNTLQQQNVAQRSTSGMHTVIPLLQDGSVNIRFAMVSGWRQTVSFEIAEHPFACNMKCYMCVLREGLWLWSSVSDPDVGIRCGPLCGTQIGNALNQIVI